MFGYKCQGNATYGKALEYNTMKGTACKVNKSKGNA
jgi:hypothetical protein